MGWIWDIFGEFGLFLKDLGVFGFFLRVELGFFGGFEGVLGWIWGIFGGFGVFSGGWNWGFFEGGLGVFLRIWGSF